MDRTIGQFASRPVHAVEADSKVLDALTLMSERRISCVVVLEQQEPTGILTERDVVFAAHWVLGQSALSVRDVMNNPVLTAPEVMPLNKACELFCEHGIRHLVVLDERLDMGGIFTQTDLVRALREEAFEGCEDISKLMSEDVLQVSPEVSARYALSHMARRAVSCVVVVEHNAPVGVFTERDVVRLIAEGADLTNVSVGSVMSSNLVTASSGMSPFSAINLMYDRSVRRLIVLNATGEMAGLLTQTDLGRVQNASAMGAAPSPIVPGMMDGFGRPQTA